MLFTSGAVVFAMALALQTESQPRAPQDAQPQLLEENITISGRVTDRDTGQGLPRARVGAYTTLIDLKRGPVASTTTDENGTYELTGLPAGRYMVLAEPPPHVSSHLAQGYGYDAPYDPSSNFFVGPEHFVTSNLRNVDLALSRALAIEGRVISDDAEPVAGLSVMLYRIDRLNWDIPVRTTDDRGSFRHFGLVHGRYRVCVSPPATADPSSPRSIRRTCYPSNRQSLELGSASIGGLDIRLARGKAATISGIALTASGAPLDEGHLRFFEEGDGSGKSLPIERTAPGRFVIRYVEPGAYRVVASLPLDPPQERGLRERIDMPVAVDGDVDNLVVRTRQPSTIAGAVQFEDGMPPRAFARVFISARSENPLTGVSSFGSDQAARIQDDQGFQLGGIFEASRLVVNGLPSGSAVKAVMYRGRDIKDLPIEFQSPSDPHPITIVVTNRAANLSGHVVASAKRPLMVMLISADRARWASRGGLVSTTAVKPDGTFQMASLPPGDYVVTVVPPQAMMEVVQSPTETLERLAQQAERISLAEGDQRTMTLYANDR
jgi:hypothetical protein